MTINTSATGGYLAATDPTSPPADDALADTLQAAVAGITGLPGSLVRPRWQPTPPPQPGALTDWCAIGVTRATPDANPVMWHDGTGEGSDDLLRHETIEALASFYGPNAARNAGLLRDGLAVTQNRETLRASGLAFVGAGEALTVPELLNQQWVNRCDITLTFRRQVARTYPILNILSAAGPVDGEQTSTSWIAEN